MKKRTKKRKDHFGTIMLGLVALAGIPIAAVAIPKAEIGKQMGQQSSNTQDKSAKLASPNATAHHKLIYSSITAQTVTPFGKSPAPKVENVRYSKPYVQEDDPSVVMYTVNWSQENYEHIWREHEKRFFIQAGKIISTFP